MTDVLPAPRKPATKVTRVRESISENLILTLRTDTAYDCCNASNSISGGQPIRGDRDFMQALRLPTSVAGEMWMLVARGIVHNVTPNTVFTWQRLNDSLLDQPVEGAIERHSIMLGQVGL